jgi:hypothetical protein
MSQFEFKKSFDIDNGELDQCKKHECFVLGYELAMIDSALSQPEPISQLVHAKNRERVIKSCIESGRPYSLTWMEGDPSEDWMMLSVAPVDLATS